jgi:hypothetical protein
MKKKRFIRLIVIVFSLLIISYSSLYFFRWSFRNDNSLIGKIVNASFNLNRLNVKSDDLRVKIVWKSDNGRFLIYEKGNQCMDFGNVYGVNSFIVFSNGKKLESFSFLNKDQKHSYDLYFVVKNHTVVLRVDDTP